MTRQQIEANARAPYAAKIAELVAERDELVAALKGALVLLERLAPDTDRKLVGGSECSIGHYASYHVDVIRAALAKLS
jgi:hypothetical protein